MKSKSHLQTVLICSVLHECVCNDHQCFGLCGGTIQTHQLSAHKPGCCNKFSQGCVKLLFKDFSCSQRKSEWKENKHAK